MLDSVYVIPGYTFFYWGFTLPKRTYPNFIDHFGLKEGNLVSRIKLTIGNKRYDAKIRMARITTKRFPNRNVVQIFYDTETDTLKALRKMFIYSYATTINKNKSDIKELLELVHMGGNEFKVKPVAKQKTGFDKMFNELEDRNLFAYWKNSKKGENKTFFIDFSRRWLDANDLDKHLNRVNVVYVLYNSKRKQLYVGKANILGNRVKRGEGRIGLDPDWDKFMFFEIDPEYSPFIEQIESFLIRAFAALMENDVKTVPLKDKNIRLVNKQLKRK